MSLLSALRSHLAADAGVAALVGTRIRPGLLAAGDRMPAIRFFQVSGARARDLDGDAGRAGPRWQFDCLADTPLAAETLEAAVIAALNDLSATIAGVAIEGAAYADARDLTAEELPGTPAVRHGRAVDFFIPHRV